MLGQKWDTGHKELYMQPPMYMREETSEKKLNANTRETSKSKRVEHSRNACHLSQFDGAEIIHKEECRIRRKARGSTFIDST
jgi:hypothetical protein